MLGPKLGPVGMLKAQANAPMPPSMEEGSGAEPKVSREDLVALLKSGGSPEELADQILAMFAEDTEQGAMA